MDREALCESLILWVETFNLDVPHETPEELSDGVAMSQVLYQIAPDHFTESWKNKIKTEDVTNWRLKVSNLKKILKGILEYNLEVLGIQIHDFQMPDVNAIGEHNDRCELGRLLQLILGCAVNCSEKQEYIQRIMAMEESVQHVVMTAIQELMTKEIATDVDSEVGEQLKRTMDDLNSAIEAKDELMQRCHDLDLQVAALLEEKQNLSHENERLSERLNQAENLDDPSTPAGKRFQQIQHQLEQCQEDNYKLESAKDDYRIKVEVFQKEISELKEKNAELGGMADECRGLKDELDVLRHSAEQVIKYETQIDSYKKKMDELSDLRGQVKLLEEKNTKYMQENLEIQEEVRKSGTIKQQLDVYKRQVHELQSKLTEETKRADKSEFEAKRMVDKVSTLQREKEHIMTERDSLREVNEELRCTQLQHVGSTSEDLNTTASMEMLSLPPEIKEKMLRLEHENKMLKLKNSGDSDEQTEVVQGLLDDANARKNELETELRLANQKTMELEAQIEDLQEMAKSTVSSSELIELKKKLEEQIQLTQQKDIIVQKERDNVSELQNQMTTRNELVEKLRDEIEKKDEEKKVMGDKYKKYFDKARAVITSQEQKLKSSGNHYPDVQALKQQIQEKDRYIDQLLKDQEKSKNTFEQEEKMMVSAWYNLGIQLHRQAAIDRLENSQGQAFLSRQRQVHLRGQQRMPNSHSNPSSSHDNINLDLDPSNQTNQIVCRGDGCFSSLFDCMLARVQDERRTDGSRSNSGSHSNSGCHSDGDDTGSVRASAVHSHLLTGMLGIDLEQLREAEEHLSHVDKSRVEYNKVLSAYEIHRHLEPSFAQPSKCRLSSQSAEYKDTMVIDAMHISPKRKCLLTPDLQIDSEFVPETPTRNTDKSNPETPLLDNESYTTELDKSDSSTSEDFLINTKNSCSRSLSESLLKSRLSSLSALSDREPLLDKSNSTVREPSYSSFFAKLDDYDSESGEPDDSTTDEKQSLLSETGNHVLPCDLLDRTSRTPARDRYHSLQDTQDTPFVQNFSSERVTKRRSRRKRKIPSQEIDKENTSADDSLLLKQFCEGASQLS